MLQYCIVLNLPKPFKKHAYLDLEISRNYHMGKIGRYDSNLKSESF